MSPPVPFDPLTRRQIAQVRLLIAGTLGLCAAAALPFRLADCRAGEATVRYLGAPLFFTDTASVWIGPFVVNALLAAATFWLLTGILANDPRRLLGREDRRRTPVLRAAIIAAGTSGLAIALLSLSQIHWTISGPSQITPYDCEIRFDFMPDRAP